MMLISFKYIRYLAKLGRNAHIWAYGFGHNSAIIRTIGLKFNMGLTRLLSFDRSWLMKNPRYDAYFPYSIFRPLLAGKWTRPLGSPLLVRSLITQPKSWLIGWPFRPTVISKSCFLYFQGFRYRFLTNNFATKGVFSSTRLTCIKTIHRYILFSCYYTSYCTFIINIKSGYSDIFSRSRFSNF